MYAWHLKKVQIKQMSVLYPAFLIITMFAFWKYLDQIPDMASEEQLKSVFLLVQATGIFLLIGCQVLDLSVFFERGVRAITASYQKRIFLWDIFSFILFLIVFSPVVIRFCIINEQCTNGWWVIVLQLSFVRLLIFTLACTRVSVLGAAATGLGLTAASWYQSTFWGESRGILVCNSLPEGVSPIWYQIWGSLCLALLIGNLIKLDGQK